MCSFTEEAELSCICCVFSVCSDCCFGVTILLGCKNLWCLCSNVSNRFRASSTQIYWIRANALLPKTMSVLNMLFELLCLLLFSVIDWCRYELGKMNRLDEVSMFKFCHPQHIFSSCCSTQHSNILTTGICVCCHPKDGYWKSTWYFSIHSFLGSINIVFLNCEEIHTIDPLISLGSSANR